MPFSKKEQAKRDAARPTKFSVSIGNDICAEIANGSSLRTVLKEDNMPNARTFFEWIRNDDKFAKQYAHACEERTEAMAEDIMELSDNVKEDSNAIQKVRLQTENRKWLMAKMKPKKYGDKLDVTSDNKPLPTPIYGGKSGESTKD